MDRRLLVCACTALAFGIPWTGACAASVVVNGIGDPLPQLLYQSEFQLFTQSSPGTTFTYTLSNTALATFLAGTQYDLAAIEMPLTETNLQNYARTAATAR